MIYLLYLIYAVAVAELIAIFYLERKRKEARQALKAAEEDFHQLKKDYDLQYRLSTREISNLLAQIAEMQGVENMSGIQSGGFVMERQPKVRIKKAVATKNKDGTTSGTITAETDEKK